MTEEDQQEIVKLLHHASCLCLYFFTGLDHICAHICKGGHQIAGHQPYLQSPQIYGLLLRSL